MSLVASVSCCVCMCVYVLVCSMLFVWEFDFLIMFCLFACLLACVRACLRAVVLSMVQCHGESNAAVAERGLWAIANLAAHNAANKTKLGEGGACTGACSIKVVRVCE